MDVSLNKQAEIAFAIINSAATGKNSALEAVKLAKISDFEKAQEKILEAKKALGVGAEAHRKLVQYEAGGNQFQISMFLMHAEDQMLNTETITIMSEQLIQVYKEIQKTK